MNEIRDMQERVRKAQKVIDEVNPNDLIKPSTSITFSIVNEALALEKKYEKFLKPLPGGLYRKGSLIPVKSSDVIAMSTVPEFNEDDYYASFATEMKDSKSKKIKTRLFLGPTIPIRGLKLISFALGAEINRITPFNNSCHLDIMFNNMFAEEVDMDNVIVDIDHLMAMVLEFIGHDVWFIYNSRMTNDSLTIIKTVDYRIYDWHLQRYNDALKTIEESQY